MRHLFYYFKWDLGGSSVRPKSGLKVPSLIFMRCGSKSGCRALGSAGAGVFWHLLLGVSALEMRDDGCGSG